MKNNDGFYIKLAIEEAWKYQFLTYPNPAVGACVVKNNQVLSVEAHKEAGLPHAEVNALKSAFLKKYPQSLLKNLEKSEDIHNFLIQNHNDFFKDCVIFVTLEPCNHIGKTPACAMLLEAVKIKKVIIGTLDPNKEASGGKQRLENAGIDVVVGVCEKESNDLLLPFVKWSKKNFCFFKLAMRRDGSIDGGYITTQDSLDLVHNIRTKLDLFVIGGQTVRTDKPTLDSRFSITKKASDILIYSKQTDFDKTIPLFDVPNRKVCISDKLNKLDDENFIMIEGGYNLLENIKDRVDMLMLFISHKDKSLKQIDISEKIFDFKKVYSYFINQDDKVVFLLNKI